MFTKLKLPLNEPDVYPADPDTNNLFFVEAVTLLNRPEKFAIKLVPEIVSDVKLNFLQVLPEYIKRELVLYANQPSFP